MSPVSSKSLQVSYLSIVSLQSYPLCLARNLFIHTKTVDKDEGWGIYPYSPQAVLTQLASNVVNIRLPLCLYKIQTVPYVHSSLSCAYSPILCFLSLALTLLHIFNLYHCFTLYDELTLPLQKNCSDLLYRHCH